MKTSCGRCGGYIIGEQAPNYYLERRWRCINCGWYCEENVVLRSRVMRLPKSSRYQSRG
jgi:hypothetical protein